MMSASVLGTEEKTICSGARAMSPIHSHVVGHVPDEVGKEFVASRHAEPAGKGDDVARGAKRIIRVGRAMDTVGQCGWGCRPKAVWMRLSWRAKFRNMPALPCVSKAPAAEAILEFPARLKSQQRVVGVDPVACLDA